MTMEHDFEMYDRLVPATLCPLHPDNESTIRWDSVDELKQIQHHFSPEVYCPFHHDTDGMKDIVLTQTYQGATPLIMAAREGSLEAVRFILEEWKADVHAVGTFHRLGKKIQGVSPLFVAAARGYEHVVRFLVEKGADVHCRTISENSDYSGLTPLHAAVQFLMGDCTACRCSQQENIIRFLVEECGADPSATSSGGVPIWVLSYYDVKPVTLLIKLGMDLRQTSPIMQRTCLHYWAGRTRDTRSLDVVRLLLERGAELKPLDTLGLTPLMVAAIGNEGTPNLLVLDFFLDDLADAFTTQEKVDALEVAGSSLLGYKDSPESIELGYNYWATALRLRTEATPTALVKSFPFTTRPGRSVEFMTIGELEQVKHSPPATRKTQAVLVRQRIMSGISSGGFVRYHWPLLKILLRRWANQGEFSRFLDLSFATLEALRQFGQLEPNIWTMVVTTVHDVTVIMRQNSGNVALLNPDNLLTTMQLIEDTDRHHLPGNADLEVRLANGQFVNHLDSIRKFVSILADRDDLDMEIRHSLYRLVRRDGRDHNGRNLLLIAAQKSVDSALFPTVRLLVEVGADPDAVDVMWNSAMHLVARRALEPLDSPTVNLLLQAETHHDRRNIQRRTALEVYYDRTGQNLRQDMMPTWGLIVPSLACQSARTVRRYGISYDATDIPSTLFSFIRLH